MWFVVLADPGSEEKTELFNTCKDIPGEMGNPKFENIP